MKKRLLQLAIAATPVITGCQNMDRNVDGFTVINPLPGKGHHAFFSPDITKDFCNENTESYLVCHNVEEPEQCNPEGISKIIRTDLHCSNPDLDLIIADVFSNGEGITPQKAFCQSGSIGLIDSRPSNFPGMNCLEKLRKEK